MPARPDVAARGIRPGRRLCALVGLLLLALGSACSSPTRSPHTSVSPPDPVRALVPTGAVPVDVMDVKTSARYDALLAKMAAATKSDPNAFIDQVKAAPPGEPIPYSPRSGLTMAEYDELLREVDNVHLVKVADAVLRFTPESDSRFRLDGGDALKQLSGVVIDLKRNVVETPLGVCADRSDFTANDQQPLTGPANGTEWSLQEGDPSGTATSVSFGLGRVVATGKVTLSYTARRIVGGKPDTRITLVVMYAHGDATATTVPRPGPGQADVAAGEQSLRAGEAAMIPTTRAEPVKVTVFSLRRADPQPDSQYNVPGMEYVVADIETCAGPAGSQQGAMGFLFIVLTADGKATNYSTRWAKKPDLSFKPPADKLAPNQCLRGYLTFEVPPGSARSVRYSNARTTVVWTL